MDGSQQERSDAPDLPSSPPAETEAEAQQAEWADIAPDRWQHELIHSKAWRKSTRMAILIVVTLCSASFGAYVGAATGPRDPEMIEAALMAGIPLPPSHRGACFGFFLAGLSTYLLTAHLLDGKGHWSELYKERHKPGEELLESIFERMTRGW